MRRSFPHPAKDSLYWQFRNFRCVELTILVSTGKLPYGLPPPVRVLLSWMLELLSARGAISQQVLETALHAVDSLLKESGERCALVVELSLLRQRLEAAQADSSPMKILQVELQSAGFARSDQMAKVIMIDVARRGAALAKSAYERVTAHAA